MKVDWTKTLNNVVYKHKEDTIEFSISDIEDLANYIAKLNQKIYDLKLNNEVVAKDNARLSKDIATLLLTKPNTHKLSEFEVYA